MNQLFCIASFICGRLLFINDCLPLTRRYEYRIRKAQLVAVALAILGIAILLIDAWQHGVANVVADCAVTIPIYIIFEFVLARINPKNRLLAELMRIGLILLLCSSGLSGSWAFAFVLGVFCTNTPTGAVFQKLRVARFPKAKKLDLQAMIDEVEAKGGGVVRIPAGVYTVDGFVQVNCSDITIEGELDDEGKPATQLICTAANVNGEKNPWLSPFFITTGEKIQPSNIFWGLDFKNKAQHVKMESSSLSDPGSDGKILTPTQHTRITSDAAEGTTTIKVESTEGIGSHLLIGMYNTTDDGNLLKKILGIDTWHDEWAVAKKAGPEKAPSFQWLVGVKSIIDENTIELERPIPMSIEMQYEPEAWNVEMLHNVCIRNLHLSSRWSGLFHHHGLPLYYSRKQAQEMDYGWNGINMKRVANGCVENVVIEDFTNPLYVMDSVDCTVDGIEIKGHDGHQGIKLYGHACSNTIKNVVFKAYYADMMGGEGNAYCNVFDSIVYDNAHFQPVDFDFHGFSEGPMSPPANNEFRNVSGFRYIKGAGALTHLPACARRNMWKDIKWEGGRRGDTTRFYMRNYRERGLVEKHITAIGFAVAMMLKHKSFSVGSFMATVKKKLGDIKTNGIPMAEHIAFFPENIIES